MNLRQLVAIMFAIVTFFIPLKAFAVDSDTDGFDTEATDPTKKESPECDTDAARNPGVSEIPGNQKDDNCDGTVDEQVGGIVQKSLEEQARDHAKACNDCDEGSKKFREVEAMFLSALQQGGEIKDCAPFKEGFVWVRGRFIDRDSYETWQRIHGQQRQIDALDGRVTAVEQAIGPDGQLARDIAAARAQASTAEAKADATQRALDTFTAQYQLDRLDVDQLWVTVYGPNGNAASPGEGSLLDLVDDLDGRVTELETTGLMLDVAAGPFVALHNEVTAVDPADEDVTRLARGPVSGGAMVSVRGQGKFHERVAVGAGADMSFGSVGVQHMTADGGVGKAHGEFALGITPEIVATFWLSDRVTLSPELGYGFQYVDPAGASSAQATATGPQLGLRLDVELAPVDSHLSHGLVLQAAGGRQSVAFGGLDDTTNEAHGGLGVFSLQYKVGYKPHSDIARDSN